MTLPTSLPRPVPAPGGPGDPTPSLTAPDTSINVDGPILTITVHGQPKPKGSMRHVGKGRMVEQVEGSPDWRANVRDEALVAAHRRGCACTDWHDCPARWTPLTGPLTVEATVTVRKPTSAPKRRRTWPITRSSYDVDKHARNLLDALVDAGVMRDDAQVVELTIRKVYPGEHAGALPTPGALIRIWRIGEEAITP